MIPLQSPLFCDAAIQTAGFSNDLSIDFLGIPLFDMESLLQLLVRFGFNLLVSWIIVHFLYYRRSGRRDYYNTFLLFSVTIFLLIFLLDNVKLQIGFALGLFAIFGMIRYRTETVPIREMTYLFMIIGLAVINGLAMTVSYAELLCTNLLFILVTWFLEYNRIIKHTATKFILYDKINLITPDKETELMHDLRQRTGLDIIRFEIGNIDFLKDVAYIKIFFNPIENQINTVAGTQRLRPEDF
jgi:hypothetical protein